MPAIAQTKTRGFHKPAQLGTGKRLAARSDDIDADGNVDFGAESVEPRARLERGQVPG
jgi:hypothetical protein